ncbi:hypothetical protein TNCV_4161501 [Trichonephila clavipes]|nr:hypothetical protein TNCV_4161501 [Trichonephila clavipes]
MKTCNIKRYSLYLACTSTALDRPQEALSQNRGGKRAKWFCYLQKFVGLNQGHSDPVASVTSTEFRPMLTNSLGIRSISLFSSKFQQKIVIGTRTGTFGSLLVCAETEFGWKIKSMNI